MRYDIETLEQFQTELIAQWEAVSVPVDTTQTTEAFRNCFLYSGVDCENAGGGNRTVYHRMEIMTRARELDLPLDLGTVLLIELLTSPLPVSHVRLVMAVLWTIYRRTMPSQVTLDLVYRYWLQEKLPTPDGLRHLRKFQKLWNFPILVRSLPGSNDEEDTIEYLC